MMLKYCEGCGCEKEFKETVQRGEFIKINCMTCDFFVWFNNFELRFRREKQIYQMMVKRG